MMSTGRVELTLNVDLTPHQLAVAFADMGDESQAQFFIELAEIAARWEPGNVDQWYAVGRHLVTCGCSTDAARDLVHRIAEGADRRLASSRQ